MAAASTQERARTKDGGKSPAHASSQDGQRRKRPKRRFLFPKPPRSSREGFATASPDFPGRGWGGDEEASVKNQAKVGLGLPKLAMTAVSMATGGLGQWQATSGDVSADTWIQDGGPGGSGEWGAGAGALRERSGDGPGVSRGSLRRPGPSEGAEEEPGTPCGGEGHLPPRPPPKFLPIRSQEGRLRGVS